MHNEKADEYVATMNFSLVDRPGVLSTMINELSTLGANILTVNQNIPVDGVAPVSISIRVNRDTQMDKIMYTVSQLDGVVEARLLTTH